MYSFSAVCIATGGLLYGLMEQERAGRWNNDIQYKRVFTIRKNEHLKLSQFLTNSCFNVTIVIKTFNLMTLVITNDLSIM